MKRAAVVLVIGGALALGGCSGGKAHARATVPAGAVSCPDHRHPDDVARLRKRVLTPAQLRAYVDACGSYSSSCASASTQALDPKTGKPTGPMVTVSPRKCTYTRDFRGRRASAHLVHIAGQCYLRAAGMPETAAPCTPRPPTP